MQDVKQNAAGLKTKEGINKINLMFFWFFLLLSTFEGTVEWTERLVPNLLRLN